MTLAWLLLSHILELLVRITRSEERVDLLELTLTWGPLKLLINHKTSSLYLWDLWHLRHLLLPLHNWMELRVKSLLRTISLRLRVLIHRVFRWIHSLLHNLWEELLLNQVLVQSKLWLWVNLSLFLLSFFNEKLLPLKQVLGHLGWVNHLLRLLSYLYMRNKMLIHARSYARRHLMRTVFVRQGNFVINIIRNWLQQCLRAYMIISTTFHLIIYVFIVVRWPFNWLRW